MSIALSAHPDALRGSGCPRFALLLSLAIFVVSLLMKSGEILQTPPKSGSGKRLYSQIDVVTVR